MVESLIMLVCRVIKFRYYQILVFHKPVTIDTVSSLRAFSRHYVHIALESMAGNGSK